MAQPRFPLGCGGTLSFRRQTLCWMLLLHLSQHGAQLLFEPGMLHRIGHRAHAFGADLAGSWAQKRQQLGGPAAFLLVGLHSWMSFRLPAGPRLRDSLIGSGFIFV